MEAAIKKIIHYPRQLILRKNCPFVSISTVLNVERIETSPPLPQLGGGAKQHWKLYTYLV